MRIMICVTFPNLGKAIPIVGVVFLHGAIYLSVDAKGVEMYCSVAARVLRMVESSDSAILGRAWW